MRTSNHSGGGEFNVAAVAQRRGVDNRISLWKYYRIADNLLKQAAIFRGEKNVLDLYVMLLRFSSLVGETIPCHRDYKLTSKTEKLLYIKKLTNALNELEALKPVVQQIIDDMNRNVAIQVDRADRFQSNYSNSSLEWPTTKKQAPNGNEIKKTPRTVGQNGTYRGQQDNFSISRPIEERFQKFTLKIPRPTEETLSRHSILGPSGLRGQWQAPISNIGVQYPRNLDFTPIEIPSLEQSLQDKSLEQSLQDKVSISSDSSSELERSTLESVYSLRVDSQPLLTEEDCSTAILDSGSVDPPIHSNIVRQPSISPVLTEVQDLVSVASPQVCNSEYEPKSSLQDELARSTSPLQLHISTAMMENFMRLAKSNTDKNLETCGILAGSLKNRSFFVTTLIIPKQESTSDSCQATNEEEIFDVQDKQSLFPLGWIHTHPSQSCFMSSIDLHTHYSYQVMLPEAVAIVMAPKDSSRTHGIFRLTTPGGISVIRNCDRRGFHPHDEPPGGGPIYQHCTDVYMNPNMKVDVIDLR
ncbi:Amsh-like ubiquitin thioesterase [Thalictrum thalictroides]|uniref:Amsh-like ubiquitin thioesterase n=1 Tax=Thalictrum thalictroides TaxID=46969 RepID=A0A7J6X0Z7_THATH|nr:Amsh-like ubiquitin thioesterase [Thalictrum thalictroides]